MEPTVQNVPNAQPRVLEGQSTFVESDQVCCSGVHATRPHLCVLSALAGSEVELKRVEWDDERVARLELLMQCLAEECVVLLLAPPLAYAVFCDDEVCERDWVRRDECERLAQRVDRPCLLYTSPSPRD